MNEPTLKRILIIDDDDELREMIGTYLNSEGFECTLACDGRDGFERLVGNTFDLVLLDLCMPKMNGVETIRAIRQVDFYIPIILFTGARTHTALEELREDEANLVLYKPISTDDLLKAIRNLLDTPK